MAERDDDFLEIKPADVNLGAASPSPVRLEDQGNSKSWFSAIALIVLLGVAAAVFLVLPDVVSERTKERVAEKPAPSSSGSSKTSLAKPQTRSVPAAEVEAGPVDTAARTAAQEALHQARDVNERLIARGAKQWAEQVLAKADAEIENGQAKYNSLDYSGAASDWAKALEILQSVENGIPQLLERTLAQGNKALDSGDAAAASAAFELALKIDPDNKFAVIGLRRASTLDQVRSLLDIAAQSESNNDYAPAMNVYQQALELDPDAKAAKDGMQRMRSALTNSRYRSAMSSGFAALETGKLSKARSAFEQALKIKPGDKAATTALQQVRSGETGDQIGSLLTEARSLEAREDWFAAVVRYDKVLKLDSTLAEARNGLSRARKRADLDVALQKFLDAPERLRTESVRNEAVLVRDRANATQPGGVKLRAQVAKLSRLIDLAGTPVPVRLVSDGKTAVTVFRVGELGQFAEHELNLLPGTYVALGTRNGYRDTRVEFKVDPERAGTTVTVRCEQRLAFGSR